MKLRSILLISIITPIVTFWGVKYVDLNGTSDATHYRSISAAIRAAAAFRVFPDCHGVSWRVI